MQQKPKVLLASQPVYSKNKKLFGYELFFRNCGNVSALDYGEELATNDVLINMCTGLSDHLDVNHRPVFVNFPESILFSGSFLPIPAENIIIELPAGIKTDDETIEALLKFKARGYRFSLDQYNFEPESNPLLEVVDYVKVNVLNEEGENTRAKLANVSGYHVIWIAERVETEQQYLKFHQLGFSLFQGYFLAKPLPVEGHSLKGKAISAAETLNAVSREGIDIDELVEIVTRNPYLAAQLLKIINSPVCALQRKISSLKEAIVYLGLNVVRNWSIMLTMLNESSVSEGTERLVLTRAKACEEYATTSVFADPEKAFLVGLLSGVSLLFGIDNKLFLRHVSLNEDIISAVLLRKGFLGQILDEIIKTEHAIMQNPGGLKGRDDTFIGSFYMATNWVEQALNTMGADK